MLHQNSVFHSVLKHVPWPGFDRLVDEYNADKRCAHADDEGPIHRTALRAACPGAQSLREIEAGLESHSAKLYHLGAREVARATLADANAPRPWRCLAACSGS